LNGIWIYVNDDNLHNSIGNEPTAYMQHICIIYDNRIPIKLLVWILKYCNLVNNPIEEGIIPIYHIHN
jgi:hypothetical protein